MRLLPRLSNPKSKRAKNSLNDLSPVDFERFIAQLYRNMGYQAKVTKQSRDHGIDVYAKRLTHLGTEIVIIQCKHYPTRTVGEAEVRNLLGAWQEFREAQYAVLVTSGTFSNDAIAFAQKHQIKLIDRPELLQLWRQHNK
ncbi:MAG: restriction endonuclease [Caldilineaceae bacterium]